MIEGKFTWHEGAKKFMIKPHNGSTDILLLGGEPISIKFEKDTKYFDFDKKIVTYPEKNFIDSERDFEWLYRRAKTNLFHAKLP